MNGDAQSANAPPSTAQAKRAPAGSLEKVKEAEAERTNEAGPETIVVSGGAASALVAAAGDEHRREEHDRQRAQPHGPESTSRRPTSAQATPIARPASAIV